MEGISSVLPVFSTVVFQNCSAGTKDHAFNAEGGIITEITGSGGANTHIRSHPVRRQSSSEVAEGELDQAAHEAGLPDVT